MLNRQQAAGLIMKLLNSSRKRSRDDETDPYEYIRRGVNFNISKQFIDKLLNLEVIFDLTGERSNRAFTEDIITFISESRHTPTFEDYPDGIYLRMFFKDLLALTDILISLSNNRTGYFKSMRRDAIMSSLDMELNFNNIVTKYDDYIHDIIESVPVYSDEVINLELQGGIIVGTTTDTIKMWNSEQKFFEIYTNVVCPPLLYNNLLYIGIIRGDINIRDFNGQLIGNLEGYRGDVDVIAVFDINHIISSSNGNLMVWDIRRRTHVAEINTGIQVNKILILPNYRVAVISGQYQMSIFDMSGKRHFAMYNACQFVYMDSFIIVGRIDGSLLIIKDGTYQSFEILSSSEEQILEMKVSPVTHNIITVSENNIEVFDMKGGSYLIQDTEPVEPVYHLAILPRNRIAVGLNRLKIYDLNTTELQYMGDYVGETQFDAPITSINYVGESILIMTSLSANFLT